MDDISGTELLVLGQPVIVDGETFFGPGIVPAAAEGLTEGQVISVSGLPDASGRIQATRIALASGQASYQLVGKADDVDSIGMQLEIGSLLVDYSGAGTVSGFPGGIPASGDSVRVIGTLDGDGTLLADSLELVASEVQAASGDAGEIEGYISVVTSASSFRVGQVPVQTNAMTTYSGGTAASIGFNVKVEVEGTFDAGGVLVAEEVEFKQSSVLRIEARVDSINPANGTLIVYGITVETTGLTDLMSIQPGDCAKVHGNESVTSPGVVVATKLEREDSCGTTLVRGFVESTSDPDFTVLGRTISTDGGTSFPGSRAAFFATAAGRLAESKGPVSGGALVASEIEFKD